MLPLLLLLLHPLTQLLLTQAVQAGPCCLLCHAGLRPSLRAAGAHRLLLCTAATRAASHASCQADAAGSGCRRHGYHIVVDVVVDKVHVCHVVAGLLLVLLQVTGLLLWWAMGPVGNGVTSLRCMSRCQVDVAVLGHCRTLERLPSGTMWLLLLPERYAPGLMWLQLDADSRWN